MRVRARASLSCAASARCSTGAPRARIDRCCSRLSARSVPAARARPAKHHQRAFSSRARGISRDPRSRDGLSLALALACAGEQFYLSARSSLARGGFPRGALFWNFLIARGAARDGPAECGGVGFLCGGRRKFWEVLGCCAG